MTTTSHQLVEGQATYGMANLRSEQTGLPVIVFISQRDDARNAARQGLAGAEGSNGSDGLFDLSCRAQKWPTFIATRITARALDRAQLDVIDDYRNGEIEYTEDAMAMLRPI